MFPVNPLSKFSPVLLKYVVLVLLFLVYSGAIFWVGADWGRDAEVGRQAQARILAEAQRAQNAENAAAGLGPYFERHFMRAVTFNELIAHFERLASEASIEPPKPRIIIKTETLTETEYVEVEVCPATELLGPDDLRLFNFGNKRSQVELGYPGGVPTPLPARSP